MIPKYIRVVLPSNKNIQVLVPGQQSIIQDDRYSKPQQIGPCNLTSSVI